jgi:uncharacterized protein
MRWMGVAVLVACSSSSPRVDQPPAPSGKAVDPAAALATKSEAVTLTVGARSVPGTIVAPADPGPWPAVVLLAGSGPTDRDWNSKLIVSKNGSGKLLAEALAAHGAVVIRFDKAGSGENAGPPLAEWTFDTYRDESAAALAALRARPDVRKDKVFVAGHSEGGIHATRLAAISGTDVAGVIYLASASRSMADTMITQIEASMRNPVAGLTKDFVDADVASLRAALNDFLAGKPVDPAKASALPPVQQLVAGIVAPETAGLTRGLLGFDNAKEAPKVVAVPVLIVGGGKDIQVDAELDTKPLHAAFVAAKRDATLRLAPDADHVLKHEPKTVVQIRADLQAAQDAYNADGRVLDAELTASILTWLADRTR